MKGGFIEARPRDRKWLCMHSPSSWHQQLELESRAEAMTVPIAIHAHSPLHFNGVVIERIENLTKLVRWKDLAHLPVEFFIKSLKAPATPFTLTE